jgi:SAM-dependent methyltransferase
LLHLGSIEWTISGLFWPPTATFDLIASTTSFDHSTDPQAGLVECARVLRPAAGLVLANQFTTWLSPRLANNRRGKPAPANAVPSTRPTQA